ncbi:PIR Superfamily Protein [Plasmodium ovale wallikeri]|uniref:PIR Superfamily Protein n=1 Tax=Plasmodium ovale wallikeri TaxID=864142 RepID=A0A1A9AHZ0_PLAOA|nr:PIR Superfamily Protein [Plasmodium ovale wallikeri]
MRNISQYRDPDINELHSNVNYQKLDKASKQKILVDDNGYWNVFIKSTDIQLTTISDTLLNTFYYVVNMKADDASYNERWNYLYFWMGLKLLENSHQLIFKKVMKVLETLRSGRRGTTDEYNDDMFNINTEQFKNLKKIYDYLQSYESIRAKIKNPDTPCTAAYRDYVTDAYDFYIEQKTQCKKRAIDNYCNIVNRFVKQYVKEDLTKFTCSGTKVPEVKNLMDQEGDTQYLGRQHPSRGLSPDMSPASGGLSPSSGYTNAMSIVLPLLGTASILFAWFRFRPLGSSLYNRIFKKEITHNYEQEEEQEILENSYPFPLTDAGDKAHHIAYHTT